MALCLAFRGRTLGKNSKLFQKRRAASEDTLKRRIAKRQTNKRVLIVCEGEKTELVYLREFICTLKLVSVDIEVCGDAGSAPISVVQYAERRARAEGSAEDAGYDAVFCVFDRDTHPTFDEAKSKILTLQKRGVFPSSAEVGIVSNPSFEYWFLLHFRYDRSPFTSAGSKSAGTRVIDVLRECPGFGSYEKALSKNILTSLLERTDTAVGNAQTALNDVVQTGEENPSTLVHLLISYLRSLAIPKS